MEALSYSKEKGFKLTRRGKVRDVYDLGDGHLMIVACDIPGKGIILTQLSNFWFEKTTSIIKNHMVDPDPGPARYPDIDWYYPELKGRTVLTKKCEPLPIESIVRGYIVGSGWKEYKKSGTVCGIRLPADLKESSRLPETLFTPSTKADSGHDENISFEAASDSIGRELAEKVRDVSLKLYNFAAEYALGKGIIIADTKFEFGLSEEGELILIDEILTPDSSRFWPADQYKPGGSQPSFDKQFVRDYLENSGWNKEPPAPAVPDEIVKKTVEKYQEALEKLTGKKLQE